MKPQKKQIYSFRADPGMIEAAKRQAFRKGISFSTMIQQLIFTYLKKTK